MFLGFLPWIIGGICVMVLVASVDMANFLLAFFCLVVVLAIAIHSFGLAALALAVAHPAITALAVLAYVALGTVWGILKWTSNVYRLRDNYQEYRAERMHNMYKDLYVDGVLNETGERMIREEAAVRFSNSRVFPPKPSDYKQALITSMTFWPISLLTTFLNDPIRRLFLFIYKRIAGFLQSISDRAFRF